MSHAVLRGAPRPAQLYLDKRLQAAGPGNNVAHVLLHCMGEYPDHVFLIDAVSGNHYTNATVLRHTAQVSRALQQMSCYRRALLLMASGEALVSVYLGLIAAGVVTFIYDPRVTPYEVQQCMELVNPDIVFCEADNADVVLAAGLGAAHLVVSGLRSGDGFCSLDDFVRGFSDEWKNFRCVEVRGDEPAIFIATSGTTGAQKATILAHQALIAQLPTMWLQYTKFPSPEERMLLLSSPQWMTYTTVITTAIAYRMTVVVSRKTVTVKNTLNMIEEFKPTWMLSGPGAASELVGQCMPATVASLRTLLLAGAPVTSDTIDNLQKILHPKCRVVNSYGTTETAGYVAQLETGSPRDSLGKVVNILDYKIVNKNGGEVTEPNEEGELYLKSDIIVTKGYHNNAAATSEVLVDGWLRTGDIVRLHHTGDLIYIRREKIGFKYKNYHISPEELERVLSGVRGVSAAAVAAAGAGPAALLVLAPGADTQRVLSDVRYTFETSLSEYKRLRGGVALVEHLPRTRSGKLDRRAVQALLDDKQRNGQLMQIV